jgi:mutator protein MutT
VSDEPRNSTDRRPIEVAAGLIFRGGRLLLAQRFPGQHLGSLWEFPGGKRERGETYEQCLARELREELGVEVVVGRCLQEVTHNYPEKLVHLRFFRCTLKSGEPQAIGCQAVAWVERDQLEKYVFPPADKQLIAWLSCTADVWVE